jgi:hypothetical protein
LLWRPTATPISPPFSATPLLRSKPSHGVTDARRHQFYLKALWLCVDYLTLLARMFQIPSSLWSRSFLSVPKSQENVPDHIYEN